MSEGHSDGHVGITEMRLHFEREDTGKDLGTWLPGYSSGSDFVGKHSLAPELEVRAVALTMVQGREITNFTLQGCHKEQIIPMLHVGIKLTLSIS